MSSEKPFIVKCPTCSKAVNWDKQAEFRPFCSERCKLIDLGEWAMEEKKIPGEPAHLSSDDETDLFFH